jgi:hypothetical protein
LEARKSLRPSHPLHPLSSRAPARDLSVNCTRGHVPDLVACVVAYAILREDEVPHEPLLRLAQAMAF